MHGFCVGYARLMDDMCDYQPISVLRCLVNTSAMYSGENGRATHAEYEWHNVAKLTRECLITRR
jgi:hypothetical protein